MSKKQLTAIVNINIEIPTGELTEDKATEMVENFELPHGYLADSFELVKFIEEDLPTREEIKQYMELHNADEVGEDDPWDMETAEYHLLLSDEYHENY